MKSEEAVVVLMPPVRVKVSHYEASQEGGDAVLFFGETDDGGKVSFHVSGRGAQRMVQSIDDGALVEVELDERKVRLD